MTAGRFDEGYDRIYLHYADDGSMDEINALLNAELEALINSDRSEDATFKLLADDVGGVKSEEGDEFSFAEFMKDSDDAESEDADGPDDESAVAVGGRKEKVSSGILLGVVGFLSAAVMVMLVVVAVSFLLSDDSGAGRTVLSAPASMFNNTNNLFPNMTELLNGGELTLTRVAFDSYTSVFFFNRILNIDYIDIRLIGDNGRVYELDPSFYPFVDTLNSERTVLRFEPFDGDTEGLTLYVTDRRTGSAVSFTFGLEGNFSAGARYLRSPVSVTSNIPGINITVDNIMASTVKTIADFSLRYAYPGGRLVFGVSEGENAGVTFAAPTRLAPLTDGKRMVYFPESNIYAGRAYFAPIPNVRGTGRMIFRDIAIMHDVDVRIPMPSVWERTEQVNLTRGYGHTIQAGMFTVNIENAHRVGNYIILVAHAVNDEVLAVGGHDPLGEEYKREEAYIDAQIEVRLRNGETASFDGMIRTRQAGTDILFDLSEYAEEISGLPVSAYTVVINSVSFLVGDVVVEIDMDGFTALPYNAGLWDEVAEVIKDIRLPNGGRAYETVGKPAVFESDGVYSVFFAYSAREEDGSVRYGHTSLVLERDAVKLNGG